MDDFGLWYGTSELPTQFGVDGPVTFVHFEWGMKYDFKKLHV